MEAEDPDEGESQPSAASLPLLLAAAAVGTALDGISRPFLLRLWLLLPFFFLRNVSSGTRTCSRRGG